MNCNLSLRSTYKVEIYMYAYHYIARFIHRYLLFYIQGTKYLYTGRPGSGFIMFRNPSLLP